MGWRIVYIEESEYLTLYLDNIKIKNNIQDITIPISDIHTLIVDNYKSVLSVNLLNKCSIENVNIILCGYDHLPQTIILPISGNNQSPKMLRFQLSLNDSSKGIMQKMIVKAKIENQKRILIKNNKSIDVIDKLNGYINEVQLFDSTNREGLSAKIYFRELFGKDFIRFKEDTINSALNYGYSILRSQISKVLLSRGMNTSIGIFHKGPENAFNLSDDIIEVFRPIIDNYVFNNISNNSILTRENRLDLIKLTLRKMKYSNEKHTFLNVINLYIIEIIKALETGITDIQFPNVDFYDV